MHLEIKILEFWTIHWTWTTRPYFKESRDILNIPVQLKAPELTASPHDGGLVPPSPGVFWLVARSEPYLSFLFVNLVSETWLE